MNMSGFTIVEMLVASAITMIVTAATFALMDPAHGTFAAQLDAVDMQQRLRVGADTLARDLLMAGGGAYSGTLRGSLAFYFAPILPYRVGNLRPDPPGQFWSDRVTLVYVPATAAQTTIEEPVASTSSAVTVALEPGCPVPVGPLGNVCGFSAGMTAAIIDPRGSWDAFTISSVEGPTLYLQHIGSGLNNVHQAGAAIVQIVMYTYGLNADPAAETNQLMRYDGDRSDLPIADNVIGLSFEYYGEPSPPQLRPGSTPATTYGPTPPPLGVADPSGFWAAGENCTFVVSGNVQTPRLDWLGNGDGALVKLTPKQLTDGPWCPDPSSPGRYDADLLRIRRVRVTLRVEAANPAFRGRSPSITFDVAPRNLIK
jgi:hypothetical protein